MSSAAAAGGLAVIDKPSGWTSHDVVAKCRGIFGTRKVGHSGTLDPMATGVLVLGVGRGTKLLRFLGGLPKTYEARITFGVETDSLDADGEVTVTHAMEPPGPTAVADAAARLTGDIMQLPPMVSALKVGGKRLHQLAREGKEVERDPRPVTVHRFDVAPTGDPMVFEAHVECSAGTYVRVLAADLGRALGGGAHLSALRRSSVGPFVLEEAAPMESAEVLPLSEVARVMAAVPVSEEIAQLVANGRVLPGAELGVEPGAAGPWAVLGPDGSLLAVYGPHRGSDLKPVVVTTG
jgi:tRNA pseudouridine55 synthase